MRSTHSRKVLSTIIILVVVAICCSYNFHLNYSRERIKQMRYLWENATQLTAGRSGKILLLRFHVHLNCIELALSNYRFPNQMTFGGKRRGKSSNIHWSWNAMRVDWLDGTRPAWLAFEMLVTLKANNFPSKNLTKRKFVPQKLRMFSYVNWARHTQTPMQSWLQDDK